MSTWKDTDEYEDIDDNASNGFGAASESNANAGLHFRQQCLLLYRKNR